MKKIIILSRVSTSGQHLESQTKELVQEAKRLGYGKNQQIIIESVESAIKLSEQERVGLQQLKYYIENDNSIDCVIVWEPSRLARRQTVLYSIRDYLVEKRIQLVILNPYVKLLTEDRNNIETTASIVFSLFATISENEMKIKKERFMRAKNEMRSQGKKSAGSIIFGYTKNKECYCVPHPTHSHIVKEIFEYYANNESATFCTTYQYISRKYPILFPLLDKDIAKRKIRHLFEFQLYSKGNWCYPPIISQELMDKVREKKNNAVCRAKYHTKINFLGKGLVYCGHCGNIMTGVAGRTMGYFCNSDSYHSLQMKYKVLDWLIWEEAKRVSKNCKFMNDDSLNDYEQQIKEKQLVIKERRNNLIQLNEKQDKLLSLYLENKVNKQTYDNKYNDIVNHKNINNQEISSLNVQINDIYQIINNKRKEQNNVPDFNSINDYTIKRQVIHKYISKVVLNKVVNGITVHFEHTNIVMAKNIEYLYQSFGGKVKIYRISSSTDEENVKIYG